MQLDFDQYQDLTATTAVYPEHGEGTAGAIAYCALGLVGEAGEVANQVKKILRDDNGEMTPERRMKILDEIGDCLWYAARLATECMVSLGDIAEMNFRKLRERKEANAIHGDRRETS